MVFRSMSIILLAMANPVTTGEDRSDALESYRRITKNSLITTDRTMLSCSQTPVWEHYFDAKLQFR